MNICSLQTKVRSPPPAHCVDSVFPKNYVDKVKSIAKRYFRVYAHIFYSHLEVLRKSGIEKMFYDSLTYFLIFIDMYSLVPSTDLRPLASLVNRLVPKLKSTSAPSRSPLVTRLLNQSEEESRQMKLRLHQKDSSRTAHGSRPPIFSTYLWTTVRCRGTLRTLRMPVLARKGFPPQSLTRWGTRLGALPAR